MVVHSIDRRFESCSAWLCSFVLDPVFPVWVLSSFYKGFRRRRQCKCECEFWGFTMGIQTGSSFGQSSFEDMYVFCECVCFLCAFVWKTSLLGVFEGGDFATAEISDLELPSPYCAFPTLSRYVWERSQSGVGRLQCSRSVAAFGYFDFFCSSVSDGAIAN